MTTLSPRTETRSEPKPRPPRAARVFGYGLAAAINAALIWIVNVAPGWRWVPFLSEEFASVLGLVTLSLLVGLLLNLAYVAYDPQWFRHLGEAASAGIASVVLLQLFRVFPFDLGTWTWVPGPLRIVLVIACVATAIGALANLAMALRDLALHDDGR
jgi:hypothetical protein